MAVNIDLSDDTYWFKEYEKKEKWLTDNFERASPADFYADLFSRRPISKYEEVKSGKGNPIIQFFFGEKNYPDEDKRNDRIKAFKRDAALNGIKALKWQVPLTEGLDELKLTSFEKNQLCAISHCSFYGCRRLNNYANYLYSLTVDIDYVPLTNLKDTFTIFREFDSPFPPPTYVVNSGKGVHFVYVLEEPIWIYSAKYRKELSKLKFNMAYLLWETRKLSAKRGKIDPQECTHTYRVVGSRTKKGWLTTAYKTGKIITREDLDNIIYVSNIPASEKFSWEDISFKGKTGLSLEDLKQQNPEWFEEWYKRVILKIPVKKTPKGKFPWLYYDFKERLKGAVEVGRRYNGLRILFADAFRCGIPFEEVYNYAISLIPEYNNLENAKADEPFTVEDVNGAAAIYCYKPSPGLSLETIKEYSGVEYKRAKRNNRTRQQHLKRVRLDMDDGIVRDTRFGGVNGNKSGRKSAEEKIRSYLKDHPNATKAEVIRETSLTKPTVYKWYNAIKRGVFDSKSAM